MPKAQFDTWAVEITMQLDPMKIIDKLRNNKPPVIATIQKDKVVIYSTTLFDDEITIVKKALSSIINNHSNMEESQ